MTCSSGWFGVDCSVIVQSPNNQTAAAFGHGYILSLDGTGYSFLGNGEYHMMLSESFEIQARMVTCYRSTSCFNAVAVRVEQNTLLIHGRFETQGVPLVFVNGKRTHHLQFAFGTRSHGFTFKRTSRLRFVLTSIYGIQMSIRLYGRYLDFYLQCGNQTYCQTGQGLWGNSNFDPFDDLTSRDGNIVTSRNVSQSYIHEFFGRSWLVRKNDSLFMYEISKQREKRQLYGGGYALYFNNSGAHSGEIYSFSSSDITIEFMVLGDSHNGTLISYTSTHMFAVVVSSGVLKLQYDDTVLNTFALLQMKKWNQIALVWSKSTRILQFYHMDDTGRVRSRNFPISNSVNVFEPGGVLAIGYSRPPPSGLQSPPKEQFIGQIDELRVWNQKLDPFTISANWRKNLDCSTRTKNLASLWKFNEGEGVTAFDCVSSAHITFRSGIWQAPLWVYSTVQISRFSVDIARAYSFRFGDIWIGARHKCYQLIFGDAVASQLVKLNSATLSFFHVSCVRSVSRSNHLSEAYWTIMAVSDLYQVFFHSPSWYAQSFCQLIAAVNFPDWYGEQCLQSCIFGVPDNSAHDNCRCMNGFYGSNCTRECPGWFQVPCNDQSPCDAATGRCSCPVSSNSSRDCGLCSPGWIGSDCSVAVSINQSRLYSSTCLGFGAAHYTTFDGTSYSFGAYGEFYLIRTLSYSVQVRQVPCMNGSFCISSIGMMTGTKNITIRASFTNGGKPLIWIDRGLTELTTLTLDKGFRFRKISPQTFEIGKNETGELTILKIKTWQRYLSFQLVMSAQLCGVASGLCSSCDFNVANDFTNISGTVYWGRDLSMKAIVEIFSNHWRVSVIDSLFLFGYNDYGERRQITANGYALNFNGTVAFTRSLHDSFIKGQDFTLQFFVKMDRVGGTIICYASSFTFAVVNDASVKIYVGRIVYDVEAAVPLGAWIQLSLSYSSSSGKYILINICCYCIPFCVFAKFVLTLCENKLVLTILKCCHNSPLYKAFP